jgi:hypothetical protein
MLRHAQKRARAHARTHAETRTHARTHASMHVRARTHTQTRTCTHTRARTQAAMRHCAACSCRSMFALRPVCSESRFFSVCSQPRGCISRASIVTSMHCTHPRCAHDGMLQCILRATPRHGAKSEKSAQRSRLVRRQTAMPCAKQSLERASAAARRSSPLGFPAARCRALSHRPCELPRHGLHSPFRCNRLQRAR